jgi:hypothetical protein
VTRPVPLEGEEYEKHLEMMNSHHLWPMYPILPLVNRSETDIVGLPIAGIICCIGPDTHKFEVMLCSIYSLPAGVNSWDQFWVSAPTKKYDSYEDMLNDGWVVD